MNGRKSPQSSNAFQYLCPVFFAHCISSDACWDVEEWSEERAQGRARGGEVGQYFSKCPSLYGLC